MALAMSVITLHNTKSILPSSVTIMNMDCHETFHKCTSFVLNSISKFPNRFPSLLGILTSLWFNVRHTQQLHFAKWWNSTLASRKKYFDSITFCYEVEKITLLCETFSKCTQFCTKLLNFQFWLSDMAVEMSSHSTCVKHLLTWYLKKLF